jgi:hypothetical protein
MEKIVIKKNELLQFYADRNKSNTLDEMVKLPNDDVNVRVKKSDVKDFIKNGLDHKGWIEIVPAKRNKTKIYKVTQEQFGVLLFVLLAKKSNYNYSIWE